ncbi:MAG: hypothetical protein JNK82_38275 [Myxococcaceae bacterium]|nr:hypothetical protein [Myxococcaceae bacterium]
MTTKHALLLMVVAVVGCGRLSTDAEDAADAVETTESTSNESALMDLTAVDSSVSMCSFSSDQVAGAAIRRLQSNVRASGCVTATQAGSAVDYVMNACTGKWGRLTVTGTVHVVYTANPDCSVQAVATGTGIKVNKATVDLDATATFSRDANGVEKIVVSTHSKGAGPNAQLDHSGNYTVVRDSGTGELCRSLDGSWSTDWSAARGSATTSTNATGIKKCGDACPAAGGQVVHNGFGGRVVTVTFDGSPVAQWSSSKGKSGTIDLDCAP